MLSATHTNIYTFTEMMNLETVSLSRVPDTVRTPDVRLMLNITSPFAGETGTKWKVNINT